MIEVSFKKKPKPYWVEGNEYRPGYWMEGFATCIFHGLYTVVPCQATKKKEAMIEAIDYLIRLLQDKRKEYE